MKKNRIVLVIVTLLLINASLTSAQLNLKININSQPLWGPVAHDHVEYYYLPEYNMYYYAPKAQFVYLKGNEWLFSNSLPYQYSKANLYSTYKVVINEPRPYLRNDHYADQYKQFKTGNHKQDIIRDSHDEKYTVRKGHPNHAQNKTIAPQHNKVSPAGNKPNSKNSAKKKGNKEGKR